MEPIATPLLVSGLGERGVKILQQFFDRMPYPVQVVSAPGGHRTFETPKMEPGQAVGVRLAGGDIDISAVGTVTYVNGEHLLAFGHPMMQLGATDIPFTAAYVYTIARDLNASYKMASAGEDVGRLTQDRLTAIGGVLGQKARMIPIALKLTDTDRQWSRDFHFTMMHDRQMTPGLMLSVLSGASGQVAPPDRGTVRVHYRIDSAAGTVQHDDWYTAVGEQASLLETLAGVGGASDAIGEIAGAVSQLMDNRYRPVPVVAVTIEMAVDPGRRAAMLERVTVDKEEVKPGDTVHLEVRLRPREEEQSITRVFAITVPLGTPTGEVRVGVAGGMTVPRILQQAGVRLPLPTTVEQIVEQLNAREQNNAVWAFVTYPTVGLELQGVQVPDLPPPVFDLLRAQGREHFIPIRDYTRMSEPMDFVVTGSRIVRIRVKGEADFAGRPPTPVPGGAGEDLQGLLGGLFGGSAASPRLRALIDQFLQAAGSDPKGGDPKGGEPPPPPVELPKEPAMPSFDEVDKLMQGQPASSSAGAKVKVKEGGLARPAQVWSQVSAEDFKDGETEQTARLSDGGITLARGAQVLAKVTGMVPWALVRGKDGSAYVGGWGSGDIWRVAGEKAQKFATVADAIAITALAWGSDDALYAGVTPGGRLVRVKEGAVTAVADTGEPYIWALTNDGSGGWWLATGPRGAVVHLDANGKERGRATVADRHAFALARDGRGAVYVGTMPRGKLYRLDGSGGDAHATPIGQLHEQAVRSLAAAGDGDLWAGTATEGQIWHAHDGLLDKVFDHASAAQVTALYPAAGGAVGAVLGPEVHLVSVSGATAREDETVSNVTPIAAVAADGDAVWAATAGGDVLALEPAREGRYLSAVHNADTTARWGALDWEGNVPAGSSVAFETRTGMVELPDVSWSAWSPVKSDGGLVASTPGQFIQYRVTLKAGRSGAPRLTAMRLHYLPKNRPPTVKINAPERGEAVHETVSVVWSGEDPDKDTLTYDVFVSSDGGVTWTPAVEPVKEKPAPPAEVPATGAGGEATGAAGGAESGQTGGAGAEPSPLPTAAPPAEAPKKEVKLAGPPGPTTETTREWDTKSVPDGRYLVKVIVSDEAANPSEPLTAEMILGGVLVDNTAPEFDIKPGARAAPPAQVVVTDKGSWITGAEYRVDDGQWIAAGCADLVFDSARETLLLKPEKLAAGEHTLEIQVRDAAGNLASRKIEYKKP